MQIQAPYTGTGLITIERDHVYAWRWFHTSTNSSVQEIQVPQGLEGNGYVSVSFVRDPASEEIYTSPLSVGVQPFSIALDARRNAVTLRAAGQVKPGEDLAITYRTARPARMALFAVDEGILQVARYRTPDPLSFFFRKRSLDVSTRQILDLILPGFRQSMLSAPGGDEGALLGANLNPFKRKTEAPVAWWAGIVDADSSRAHRALEGAGLLQWPPARHGGGRQRRRGRHRRAARDRARGFRAVAERAADRGAGRRVRGQRRRGQQRRRTPAPTPPSRFRWTGSPQLQVVGDAAPDAADIRAARVLGALSRARAGRAGFRQSDVPRRAGPAQRSSRPSRCRCGRRSPT